MVNHLQEKNSQAANKILALVEHFDRNGDAVRSEKAKNLLKKVHQQDFHIAFCGHFSAGKSTMINALLGGHILPSSPVPTSANLVKIHNGIENFAIVYEEGKPPLMFQAPYDFKLIKNYCKKGNIREIEMSRPGSELPPGLTVMDTPGVDSNDDAHRIATQSAIYLADMIFYVMDYNHVQSELNFTFTKELLGHGLDLYLIVNQIDKHNEEELPFEAFQQTVAASFASWQVHPRGIFYTSLKEPGHPHNQFGELKQLIEQAVAEKDQRLAASVETSWHVLEKEHSAWLEEKYSAKAAAFEEIISAHPETGKIEAFEAEQQWQDKEKEVKERAGQWEASFQDSLGTLLQNAYLMPFETREKARLFLEAAQKDFQAGFFLKKKKRDEARRKRLHDFYSVLRENVEAQINWHIRALAQQSLKGLELPNAVMLEQQGRKLSVSFNEDLLKQQVKDGARITGDYILRYCEDVSEKIKSLTRRVCDEWKQQVLKMLHMETETRLAGIRREVAAWQALADAYRAVDRLKQELAEKKEQLQEPALERDQLYTQLLQEWENEKSLYRVYRQEDAEAPNAAVDMHDDVSAVKAAEETAPVSPPQAVLAKIKQAAILLADKQGFKRYIDHLRQKAGRLEHQHYTVALFGAFSAGKSSFANALIGAKVLPVSPNPTTAAINRICPPVSGHPHGTAAVHIKTAAQLLEDLQHSLSVFGLSCTNFQEALEYIESIRSMQTSKPKEKVHLSFLRAFQKGYPRFQDILGCDIEADLHSFSDYAANEEQSCFVESIDLYYSCSLTRIGITLVDTPGADSINARHTGVAFKYIKESDAILFVTYYNHAFARADREFLIQLGRVKDAFELDKMFFVVNAVDLAESNAEYEEVMSYVKGQLLQFGIRSPRLYGVSSLLALKGETEKSQLAAFQTGFRRFLQNDLLKMVVQSAENELARGRQMVEAIISSANESRELKESKRARLQAMQEQTARILKESGPADLEAGVAQEQKELLYYVKQRVFYRFPDFFKEAFNPAVLKNAQGLPDALSELAESIGFDLAQEMRATTIRLEKYTKQLFHSWQAELNTRIKNVLADLNIPDFEAKDHETPDFQAAFSNLDTKPFEKTFKYFKSAKSFFEKNEKQKMQEELQALFEPLADAYLNRQGEKLAASLHKWMEKEFKRLLSEAAMDLNEQFAGRFEALQENVNIEEWIEIRRKLAESLSD
ncbi:dynamin family protein [Heyndrickxia acidiproducens]|uniref:dynamin family protein n=1 Tax=Heyndrickxia acidiproducens TaxID=1121084 RepID=UPI0003771EF0|nr:dynamin family protein [Heyndrickxia acidiproducens]